MTFLMRPPSQEDFYIVSADRMIWRVRLVVAITEILSLVWELNHFGGRGRLLPQDHTQVLYVIIFNVRSQMFLYVSSGTLFK
jgi:hypothetical protein